ncbi:DUF4189 domain-containing protein [Stenotrophomonas maltophilia]|uniref:DUF4189 domain-containing protein n=2 Tax=Stenotrophomonas maltophilia TaxID=40324 RepID=UPI0016601E76|nr:DUF4189 domain-containing protein [Stenotrophomonas maltophilia]MBN7835724.1 DUF4189 domain-containing protein [Stenotrophomonas maltophilia]MBN7859884.1 DUF4189 domain-containing protein [Stenotrophomonas maltophilia]MBN7917292.1 DUF4189 domain-containing protein [Stenotrophomonas maltophilia]MBO2846926.1 DUF4189 domain-containing protein [Stenotrophomonas maltophilia]
MKTRFSLKVKMMKTLLLLAILSIPAAAYAEGRCPPGQYPVGGAQGVLGCAPIPGGVDSSSSPTAPAPSGKWEKRWGAIAEDSSANARRVVSATGVSESRKSKSEAVSVALDQCRLGGGQKCQVLIVYNNQCVALADTPKGATSASSIAARAETLELARRNALEQCKAAANGTECSVIYSACSESEFKSFR